MGFPLNTRLSDVVKIGLPSSPLLKSQCAVEFVMGVYIAKHTQRAAGHRETPC